MDKKTWNNNKIQTKDELDRMHANEEVVRGLTGEALTLFLENRSGRLGEAAQ